ncbi:MAG: hypothetical protein DIU64_001030 [Caldicoprobacter oshimai]|uniref:Uncharacterized protein n=1 Tax=Caldicoprobacter faecalis TaxID=937334 RepID=A0A1I5XL60_9FIRM|nr:hypothetical protein [Caldicoprobacter faecalis]SFQ32650.1 hypothetical protein SAMN05444406_1285 [Caldicoprobacter faecalis]
MMSIGRQRGIGSIAAKEGANFMAFRREERAYSPSLRKVVWCAGKE